MRRRVELVLELDADVPDEMPDAAFALLIEALVVKGIQRGPFKVLTIICLVFRSRRRQK